MSTTPMPSAPGPSVQPARPIVSPRRDVWVRAAALQRRAPILQLIALVALFEWGTWTVTDFASEQSVRSMLVAASFLGLAGASQTLVVLIGGIDFSVPALISAGSIVISQLTGTDGWAFLPALGVWVVIALAAGITNGYVAHRFRVQPLIVTLAMGSVITGGVMVWTNTETTGSPPAFLTRLTSVTGSTFGVSIPPVVVIWGVVAVALGIALRHTVAGRRMYATGSNPVAAELVLVRTRRVWIGAYAASALVAALLGVLIAGYAGSGTITLGDPYLFEGLAAVIVGGTTFGARGDYWRTVIGALVLTVLSTLLVGKGYSTADQQIIFGVLILIVVAGYGRDARLRDRI